jgi:hypothetical protein
MTCLTFLGMVIVPLGAFSALRNEQMEQTLDLITLSALTPRRLVIGKLLAQGVKLSTLFAGMAPFVAMSFLLGGVDFVTILRSLLLVFLGSVWLCAVCLCASTLARSRAMSGFIFAGLAVLLILVLGVGRVILPALAAATLGVGVSVGRVSFFYPALTPTWSALAGVTLFWMSSLAILVLIADNRLSLPTEDRVTALRAACLAQFLLLVAGALTSLDDSGPARLNATDQLGVTGGLLLALVAAFTVTEGLTAPRRVLRQLHAPLSWRSLAMPFRPGAGRGAGYVLAQMAILVGTGTLLAGTARLYWLLAICGYICAFTGLPALAFRWLRQDRARSVHVRVAVLVLLAASLVLPDVLYYVLWQPETLTFGFSGRHLVNPLRTLANWATVDTRGWDGIPFVLGSAGCLAYVGLMLMDRRPGAPAEPVVAQDPPAAGAETL